MTLVRRYLKTDTLHQSVGLTLGHSAAIGLCLARSYLRVIKDRVWWDDRIALAAAALDMLYMLTLWVEALHRKSSKSLNSSFVGLIV